MRSSKKERPLADPSMDMTPMIDVVFLLLIFFLCMEFKSLEGKLGANLPREGRWNTAARPKETLDLRIVCTDWGREVLDEPNDPKGRFELLGHKTQVYIGARLVQDRTELELELRRAALVKVIGEAGRPTARRVTIKTGRGVTYGDVTSLIDLAIEAGFARISFGGAQGLRQR